MMDIKKLKESVRVLKRSLTEGRWGGDLKSMPYASQKLGGLDSNGIAKKIMAAGIAALESQVAVNVEKNLINKISKDIGKKGISSLDDNYKISFDIGATVTVNWDSKKAELEFVVEN